MPTKVFRRTRQVALDTAWYAGGRRCSAAPTAAGNCGNSSGNAQAPDARANCSRAGWVRGLRQEARTRVRCHVMRLPRTSWCGRISDSVQPGQTYRYRIVYYMKNPVLGLTGIADKSIENVLEIKSPPSDWSNAGDTSRR